MVHPAPDSILLLSADRRLIRGVRDLIAPARVRSLPCLRALPARTEHHRIILDPRQFSQCCLEGAVSLGKRFGRARLRALSYPSLQTPLFEITEKKPVHRARPELKNHRWWASTEWLKPRQAWHDRETIFASEGCGGIVRRFLNLARAHRIEPYSVAQAAIDLHTGPRQIERYCLSTLDYSPGLIIDLARIMSVVEDLIDTEWQLDVIAFKHGFHDAGTMSRQFLRFTAERPGAYRALHRSSDGTRRLRVETSH